MLTIKSLFLSALLCATNAAWAADQPAPALGHAPTEITMAVEIDAPIAEVWTELARIGDIYLNSPTVDRSKLSSEIAEGIGATRHMEMSIKEGATLDERVITWVDGTYMALEVYKIDGMTGVQTMGGDFRLTAQGGKTTLTSTLNYSMSNGFFGLMNKMMMKRRFAGLWASVLAGYKHHIETGERVTADTDLDLKAVDLLGIERAGETNVDTRTSQVTPPR